MLLLQLVNVPTLLLLLLLLLPLLHVLLSPLRLNRSVIAETSSGGTTACKARHPGPRGVGSTSSERQCSERARRRQSSALHDDPTNDFSATIECIHAPANSTVDSKPAESRPLKIMLSEHQPRESPQRFQRPNIFH
jgi:hypothetical protein